MKTSFIILSVCLCIWVSMWEPLATKYWIHSGYRNHMPIICPGILPYVKVILSISKINYCDSLAAGLQQPKRTVLYICVTLVF